MKHEVKECKRCGNEFDDPVPSVTNPSGMNTEIATEEWCSGCNRIAMMAVHRRSSAYYNVKAVDPVGGKRID